VSTIEIQPIDKNLYIPEKVKITKVEKFTATEKYFEVQLLSRPTLGHTPGQFVQVSIMGIGEAPISISSPPNNSNKFELVVRAAGDVTNKLHTLKEGDHFFIRGPFGHGFEPELQAELKNKHVVFVVGGIGYVPARSLINDLIAHQNQYEKISILYGCKTNNDRVYTQELAKISTMGKNVELFETVDKGDANWKGNIGLITSLISKIKINPVNIKVVIVGPPIMYKFVIIELLKLNIKKEDIFMSLERRMKCGVGKCGHCQMEGVYVCQEGPVFRYSDIAENSEAL